MRGTTVKLLRRWKPTPNDGHLNALKMSPRQWRKTFKRAWKAMNNKERAAVRRLVANGASEKTGKGEERVS